MKYAFGFTIPKVTLSTSPETLYDKLVRGFLLSGFRIKRRPAFTPVSKLKENGI